MNDRMTHRLLTLAVLAGLCGSAQAASPIAAAAAPLDAHGTLDVSNVRGRISITAWERNEVQWSGSLGEGAKLVVDRSASRVSLKVESQGARGWFNWSDGPREDSVLVIKVPASASLDLSAVSANVDVTGLRGSATIEAESVSGEVLVRASATDKLDVSSVSGDVTFDGQAGRVEAETVSGDLELAGVAGDVSVETVSGNAAVHATSVSEFKASAVSGDLSFDGALAADGRIDVESMSGDVTVTLPADIGAHVSAESFSGDLENDFGLAVEQEDGPGSSFEGKLGAGGASIDLESFSGDVSLRKR